MQATIDSFRPLLVQIATPYNMGGTGFFLQKEQLILTNEHLVRDNKEVIVEAEGIPRQMACVVFWDAHYDLAFLQLKQPYNLPTATFRTDGEPQAGDEVLAMGHPFGLDFSSTFSILANNHHPQEDFHHYQHGAVLSPGNSGGPLFDTQGRIIGMNTFDMADGQELGVALPALFIVESLRLYQDAQLTTTSARCLTCRTLVAETQKNTPYCPKCGAYLQLPSECETFEPVGTPYTIEQLLAELGHDAQLARRGLHVWEIQQGSANIQISYHEDSGLVTGDAHLCLLPSERLDELYTFLLRENYKDEGLTFSVRGRDIILSILIYDRYLDIQADKKRFQQLFERADYYDNLLVEEFGAKW